MWFIISLITVLRSSNDNVRLGVAAGSQSFFKAITGAFHWKLTLGFEFTWLLSWLKSWFMSHLKLIWLWSSQFLLVSTELHARRARSLWLNATFKFALLFYHKFVANIRKTVNYSLSVTSETGPGTIMQQSGYWISIGGCTTSLW